ncbi:hypothetical protein BU26DRAFT_520890 [Trematosphaeria pertusa]|uniref:Uncharacterized protein n=1 Tax=Trematosphaeria pertusa TaxID=390896 RepID=A0A6A6IA51_9PLEO|nr:uncharacterized protein BU26DRAFT_520890 [Trematosphaeria pertusa]KAF2246410.1 hypothetical protein BU26DRAFT_520890 [Trematosphaeria pertusa]
MRTLTTAASFAPVTLDTPPSIADSQNTLFSTLVLFRLQYSYPSCLSNPRPSLPRIHILRCISTVVFRFVLIARPGRAPYPPTRSSSVLDPSVVLALPSRHHGLYPGRHSPFSDILTETVVFGASHKWFWEIVIRSPPSNSEDRRRYAVSSCR